MRKGMSPWSLHQSIVIWSAFRISADANVGIREKTGHLARPVKKLSGCFDTSLTIKRQVNVIYSTFCHICNIGPVRQCITTDACKTLEHAPVTSRLDYGNHILYDIPSILVERLQWVQCITVRLVASIRIREPITQVFNSLRCLSDIYRSRQKILVYAYATLHGNDPHYLDKMPEMWVRGTANRTTNISYYVW